jgi:acetyl-CoA carboxylase biotin carboxyl carrier protein
VAQLEQDVMKALLEAFEQSDWQEMTVTIGGDRLHISRLAATDGAAPAPAPPPPAPTAPPAPAAAAAQPAVTTPAEPAGVTAAPPSSNGAVDVPPGTQVTSPSVGLFWRAPSPGAPPFVEVGGAVNTGDTVAIVEVMKLMNHVTAPATGTVAAILADNGAPVEFGQVLVVIDADA